MCVHLHTSIFSGGADARAPECGMENLCLFLDEPIRAVVTHQTGERGAMVGLALKLPFPAVAVGGAVVAVVALLKIKDIVLDGNFADEQSRYRRCNRCAKKGAKVRCPRCRRAWYCARECLKAARKLEICECD